MNPFIHFCARWAMYLFSLVWFRVRRVGLENVPREGGVLLVGNHTSHLDPPLIGAFAPRIMRFLARSTLGHKPWSAWFMRGLGSVLIDRDAPSREAMQTVIDVLKAGEPLLMFPEGTRSKDGKLQAFKRGFELSARRAGVSIVPLGIRGAFDAMPRGAGFPRPRKIELHFGEPWTLDQLRERGGVEAIRARVAELAGVELADDTALETEALAEDAATDQEVGTTSSASVRRRSEGPSATSNPQS